MLRTTPEHPFFVEGQGWTPAGELQSGNRLSTPTGEWLPVEAIANVHQSVTVYNFRVSDFHTYFIAPWDAAFDVWVHNTYNLNPNDAISRFGVYELFVDDQLFKVGKAHLDRVTLSTGLPTRVHQQVRKLEEQFGKSNVRVGSIDDFGYVTTQEAKRAESIRLRTRYSELGQVPLGNQKSFRPS